MKCTTAPANDVVDEPPFDEAHLTDLYVHWPCDHCGNRMFATVGMALFDHPALISFFDNRDIDLTERRVWEFEFAMTDRRVTVRSENPWEVSLTVPCRDDLLNLVVDETLTVVETVEKTVQ